MVGLQRVRRSECFDWILLGAYPPYAFSPQTCLISSIFVSFFAGLFERTGLSFAHWQLSPKIKPVSHSRLTPSQRGFQGVVCHESPSSRQIHGEGTCQIAPGHP